MEVTALCFRVLVTEFILLGTQVNRHYTQKSDADFLRIRPNRLQYFEYEFVSIHCEGMAGSLSLRGISNRTKFKPECKLKKTPNGSSCTFDGIYSLDSGEYWCETERGERSRRVNITVTDGPVILESPAHPVREGDAVTLRCRTNMSATNLQARFFKDDVDMKIYSAEKTIKKVSKSDEGMYKCSIKGVGESPESRLAVRANRRPAVSPSPSEDFSSDDSVFSPVFILWASVSIVILSLVLLLVGLLCIMKPRDSLKTASQSNNGEQNVCEEDSDDSDSVTYTVVFTKQNAADCADNKSLESNQSPKPQSGEGDHESLDLTIYSSLAVSETPQTPQHEPESSGSNMNLNPTEQEVLSEPV